jgi:transketolase
MAKKSGLSLREVFCRRLAEYAEKRHDIVVLDADLAACTYGYLFGERAPDRYYNMGIAEANMISMAAGMATTGMNVFACSFAMFTAGRAFEQIRNACAYPKLNVKIVGTYSGLTVGEDGATHQCIEDLAVMRAIPNMLVLNPCDASETEKMVDMLVAYDGPAYIRLPRDPVSNCTEAHYTEHDFEVGGSIKLAEGKDVTIIVTGIMVQEALKAKALLEAENIRASVIGVPCVKPIDSKSIIEAAYRTGAIVTAEEHNILGGLGGYVAEILSENRPVPVIRIGVQDKFGKSGDATELMELYGLTAPHIAQAAQRAICMKGKI